MEIYLSEQLLKEVHAHGEAAYPEEGAGLLFGKWHAERCTIERLFPLPNAREAQARRNRYMLTPQEYLRGEQEALSLGLEVVGVYHSHPDQPNHPSKFDRQWALPHLVYLITSVYQGIATESRAWLLDESRQAFLEQGLIPLGEPHKEEHHEGRFR